MKDTKKANADVTEAVSATTNAKTAKAKAKGDTKKKGAAMKAKTAKKTAKKLKSMKSKPPVDNTKDVKAVRALINKVLTSKEAKGQDLSFVENAHGALQVKRSGHVMFSFRKTGRGCIITHPIYTGKGKTRTRWMKHSGNKWDHLTDCQWSDATLPMLLKRIKDKKNPKDYHDEIYNGKKAKSSGLVLKAEMAKKRLEVLKKNTKKASNKKKREKSAAKKASNVVKRQAKKSTKKKTPKKASPVISKVAEAVS